jgi:hypothetical protein
VCSTFLTVKPFSLISFLLISLSTNHTETVASYVMAIFFLHGLCGISHWPVTVWANQAIRGNILIYLLSGRPYFFMGHIYVLILYKIRTLLISMLVRRV